VVGYVTASSEVHSDAIVQELLQEAQVCCWESRSYCIWHI